jgi:hypothetical protein
VLQDLCVLSGHPEQEQALRRQKAYAEEARSRTGEDTRREPGDPTGGVEPLIGGAGEDE